MKRMQELSIQLTKLKSKEQVLTERITLAFADLLGEFVDKWTEVEGYDIEGEGDTE